MESKTCPHDSPPHDSPSYGVLAGAQMGSSLAGSSFDVIYNIFNIHRLSQQLNNVVDPAILMQYNESPYNIYYFSSFK